MEECVRSSEILSKRITAKESAKISGERRESAKVKGVAFCGSVGVRQNCEECAPVKEKWAREGGGASEVIDWQKTSRKSTH